MLQDAERSSVFQRGRCSGHQKPADIADQNDVSDAERRQGGTSRRQGLSNEQFKLGRFIRY